MLPKGFLGQLSDWVVEQTGKDKAAITKQDLNFLQATTPCICQTAKFALIKTF